MSDINIVTVPKTKDNKRQQPKKKKVLACCVGLSMSNVCIRLWLGQNLSIPKNKHILTAGEGNREIASLPVAILHPSIEGECPECLPDS